MSDDKYFASLPSDEIGNYLVEKVDDYYKYLNGNGTLVLWRDCFEQYFNGYFSKGQIHDFGKAGERKYFTVNHFKNLLEHIKVLTTSQRPAFEPKAANPDYKSSAQAILARGLLDYYMYQQDLEKIINRCMDYALQSGEGWIMQEWDKNQGKVVGTKEEEVEESEDGEEKEAVEPTNVHEGDVVSTSYHPIDVIRDVNKITTEDNLWFIVRKMVDRFETAAKYPKFKEKIVDSVAHVDPRYRTLLYDEDTQPRVNTSDQIPFYVFRHKKSAALPNGRQIEFLEDGTIIFDGDLPYSTISLYVLHPGTRTNSNFGYTVAFDMIGIQKAIECLDSTILTNQSTFGVQNVAIPRASDIEATDLGGGLKAIVFNGDKGPEALNLTNTPPEIFNYKEDLIQQMETVSGVNSVSRGNPEASLKSGAALALVESMAIRFNSGFDNSYTQLLEDVGTGTISLLKDYANSKRVIEITGISNRSYLKEFTKDSLDQIDRVIVERGNALTKTISGRTAIADSLLERGLITDPASYIQLLQTGRLEPLIEGATKEVLNIRDENENLSEGKQVRVIATDNHHLHIKEHKNVLASPDMRTKENEKVIKIVLDHITEHLTALRKVDPELLMVLGQQPLGQPAGPPAPPQDEPNTPNQGVAGGPPPANAAPPGAENVGLPKMPSMPQNPMSNQPYDPSTGGL